MNAGHYALPYPGCMESCPSEEFDQGTQSGMALEGLRAAGLARQGWKNHDRDTTGG